MKLLQMDQNQVIAWIQTLANFSAHKQQIIDGIRRYSEQEGEEVTGADFFYADIEDIREMTGCNQKIGKILFEKIQGKKQQDSRADANQGGPQDEDDDKKNDINIFGDDEGDVTFTLKVRYTARLYEIRNVSTTWSILRVKTELLQELGTYNKPDAIELRLNGRSMDNNQTLEHYGIVNEVHTPLIASFKVYGGGHDDVKVPVEQQNFVQTSATKKQKYNQYPSFDSITTDTVDDALVVDNPHFAITLNNLDDFMDNYDYNEIEKLQEIKESLSNNQNHPVVVNMRQKLGTVYQVDPGRVIIDDIFYGTTNICYYIVDYMKLGVQKLIKNATEFMKKMNYTFKQFQKLILTPPPKSDDGSYEVVKSYHVSCASKKPCSDWNCKLESHNLGGAVLYMKDGKTDWYCNGRHCKIGYIIVKPVEDVKNSGSNYGMIHGNVYKSVFNEEPINVVGSGFARQRGVWKFNSGTFNQKCDKYHLSGTDFGCEAKSMGPIEQKWIEKAVKAWFESGTQNTKVNESLVIHKK